MKIIMKIDTKKLRKSRTNEERRVHYECNFSSPNRTHRRTLWLSNLMVLVCLSVYPIVYLSPFWLPLALRFLRKNRKTKTYEANKSTVPRTQHLVCHVVEGPNLDLVGVRIVKAKPTAGVVS